MKNILQKIPFIRSLIHKDVVRAVELQSRLIAAEKEVKELREALNSRGTRRVDVINAHDGEPQDEELRGVYVASVSNFFYEVMEQKIISMIVDVRQQLAAMDYSGVPSYVPREDYDWYLRGTENALWLIYDWFELLAGENKRINN